MDTYKNNLDKFCRMKMAKLVVILFAMIRYIFILFVLFLFIGCNTSVGPKSDLTTILVDKTRNDESGEFNSFFKFSHYVPLKVNDSALISKIRKIKIYEDIIYILDEKYNKIIAFDSLGNYIRQYNHLGQGPGEYSGLRDFDIQNDTLYLLSKFSPTVLKYGLSDDKFYGEDIVQKSIGIKVLPDRSYALNLGLGRADNEKSKSYNSYAVYHSDSLVYKNIPFNKHLLGHIYSFGEGHNTFYNYSDSIFTYFPFNDTVYVVNPEKGTLKPYLSVSLNKKKIEPDMSKEEVEQLMKELTPSIFSLYKWDDYMCCSFYDDDDLRRYLIFSTSGTILFCGNFNIDENKLPVRMVTYDSEQPHSQMLSILYPQELLYSYKKYGDSSNLLKDICSNINEEDNPVLVFYDFILK